MGGRNTIYLGNVGLVLFFNGNAGDRRNRVSICQILPDLKADVFLFDYRGYGDNPGSPTEEGLADNGVRSLLEARQGHIWFATGKGVSRYDGEHFKTFTACRWPGRRQPVVHRRG